MNDWRDECLVEVVYQQTGTTQRPGGQQAGTPASTIRVTHLPTGTVAQAGFARRSQHRARQVAMEMIEWSLHSQ